MRPAAKAMTPMRTHGKPSEADGRPLVAGWGRVVVVGAAVAADARAYAQTSKDSRTPATARLTGETVLAAPTG